MYNKSYYSLLFYIHRFTGLEKLSVKSSDVRGDNITSSVMLSICVQMGDQVVIVIYPAYSKQSLVYSFIHAPGMS